MLALAQGRTFPAARLSLRKTGAPGGPYLGYHMETVAVTSYEVSHSAGEPPDREREAGLRQGLAALLADGQYSPRPRATS